MIFVFFSFKGGVGRSSSLINTSRALAKKGKDVCIVDFDIAAPGIDIFNGTNPKRTADEYKFLKDTCGWSMEDVREYKDKERANLNELKPGVTEYFEKAINNADSSKSNEGLTVPPIDPYLYIYQKSNLDESAKTITRYRDPSEGILHIMRAGRHEDPLYDEKQRKLDATFNEIDMRINLSMVMKAAKTTITEKDQKELLTETKRLLKELSFSTGTSGTDTTIDDFRTIEEIETLAGPFGDQVKQWIKDGKKYEKMLALFKKELERKASYVLIDARPGLSTISILAIQKLADVAVLCFNLNPYNFEAIIDIYNRLTGPWKRFTISPLQKIVLVVTPIPRYAYQYASFKHQLDRIGKEMNVAVNAGGTKELKPIVVPYNEQMSLQDKLIVDDDELKEDPTTRAYEEIKEMLVRLNLKDIENKINKAMQGSDAAAIKKELDRLAGQSTLRDQIQVLHAFGNFLFRMGQYDESADRLSDAIQKGNELSRQGNENERIKYARHEELCIDAAFALFTFSRKYDINPDLRNRYLKRAREYLREARHEDKDRPNISDVKVVYKGPMRQIIIRSLILEGDVAFFMAEINPVKTLNLLEECLLLYQKAKDLEKNEADHWYKLGNVSATIARLSGNKAGENKNAQHDANEYFKEAILRREEFAEAYYEWGKNLYYEATACPDERKNKLEDANEKFAHATKYRSDYAEAYYFWGLSLSRQSIPLQNFVKQTGVVLEEASLHHMTALETLRVSKTLPIAERTKSLEQACIHFGSATTYRKDFKEAYFFWGSALFILQRQRCLAASMEQDEDIDDEIDDDEWDDELEDEKEEKVDKKKIAELQSELEFRDAFYKLEPAIALFFDYPNFYFDPAEIDELRNATFRSVFTIEQFFADEEEHRVFEEVKKLTGIKRELKIKFEPQFKDWLNEEELKELQYDPFFERLILYAVFRDFMDENEKEKFQPLRERLQEMSTNEILEVLRNVGKRDSWKNRKVKT
ncbi:MAG: P-loop NTPase [Candidatus Omnitrophota bacterium]